MPKMKFKSDFELTDKLGVVKHYNAGEQDVPQDVADNPFAQAHTDAGIPGIRKAPETEEEHAAMFEMLAKRVTGADMVLQPASDPTAPAAGDGLGDASPSADNMPATAAAAVPAGTLTLKK